jgi:uncharacterized membrane protein
MTESMTQFIHNLRWMGWNLFLAFIPLVLSLILFAKRSPKLHRHPFWWFSLGILILFLPNAPYILTDIIHFVSDVRLPNVTENGIIFILIPQYTAFLLLGFQCYVISLMRLTDYLIKQKFINNAIPLELVIHFLCAIGVYWGRFNRLNSWDVFTQPKLVIQDGIANFLNPNFYVGTFLFFIIFTLLYYICKLINQAIAFYWQNRLTQSSF